jgi:hypothetical protein
MRYNVGVENFQPLLTITDKRCGMKKPNRFSKTVRFKQHFREVAKMVEFGSEENMKCIKI